MADKAKAEKAQRSKFAATAKANFGHRKSLAERVCLRCVFKCGSSKTLHLGRPHRVKCRGQKFEYAEVAESADALDSGSSESNFMRVQVPSSAPKRHVYRVVFLLDFELSNCYKKCRTTVRQFLREKTGAVILRMQSICTDHETCFDETPFFFTKKWHDFRAVFIIRICTVLSNKLNNSVLNCVNYQVFVVKFYLIW